MSLPYRLAEVALLFVRGSISPARLRRELAELTWGIAAWGTGEEKRMAGAVDLALSEYEAGHMEEAQLREEILKPVQFTRIASRDVTTAGTVDVVDCQGLSPWAG